jgi:hypothetical protein
MARYIKNVARVSTALGPTEERRAEMWVGYDIVGVDDDLSSLGLLRVADDETGVETRVEIFTRVAPDDAAMYEKLGLRRNG